MENELFSEPITAVPNAPVGSIECICWSSNGLKLFLADVVGLKNCTLIDGKKDKRNFG